MSSPDLLIRPPHFWRMRCLTSGGISDAPEKFQVRIALELTLLTFCPPGPEARANVNLSAALSIVIRDEIRTTDPEKKSQSRGARHYHRPEADKFPLGGAGTAIGSGVWAAAIIAGKRRANSSSSR